MAEVLDEIAKERAKHTDEKVKLYRRYAEGSHPLNLTETQKEIIRGLISNEFCDNVAELIVSSAADRLNFLRFECPQENAKARLDSIYTALNLQSIQSDLHYQALLDGNAALMISWDVVRSRPQVTVEPWWDGSEGVYIAYDKLRNPIYAVKQWVETTEPPMSRRNIYYPTRIEKYQRTTAEWVLIETAPTIDSTGLGIGIPVIHFPNSARSTKVYGRSELSGGVTGFQDQINDCQYAISAAGQFAGYKIYTATGIAVEDKLTVKPGTMLSSQSKEASFGSLDGGDISALLELYMHKVSSVCRMTKTPSHFITGKWPSGEALSRAEQPAVDKANRQKARFEALWAEIGYWFLKLESLYGPTNYELDAEKNPITAVMSPTSNNDPMALANEVGTLLPYISNMEALRKLGYSDVDAARILKEKQAEERQKADISAAAFNAGDQSKTY